MTPVFTVNVFDTRERVPDHSTRVYGLCFHRPWTRLSY